MYVFFKPYRWHVDAEPAVYLCGDRLAFVGKFTYLGHVLVPSLSDDSDISRQYRSLCARANMLKRNFYACSHEVKIKLFQAYCTSLYTSQLWVNFTRAQSKKCKVCYNNAFRCVLGYPRHCSASSMFVYNYVASYAELNRRIVYSFWTRIENSTNTLIRTLCASDIKWFSTLWLAWMEALHVVRAGARM